MFYAGRMYSNDFINGKHEMSEFNIDTKLKRVFVCVCMHTLYRVQSSILAGNRLFHFPTISFIYIQSTIIAHRDLHFQSQNIQILHMVFTLPFQTAAPHKTKNSLQLPNKCGIPTGLSENIYTSISQWLDSHTTHCNPKPHNSTATHHMQFVHIPMTGHLSFALQPKVPSNHSSR